MLTTAQRETLDAIARLTAAAGYPPTMAEIGAARGVSAPTVHDVAVRLREAGLLTWVPRVARTIRLTPEGMAHTAPEGARREG